MTVADRRPDSRPDAVESWVAITHPRLEDLPGYLELTAVVARTRETAGADGLAWLEAYVIQTATVQDAPMDPAVAAEIARATDAAIQAALRLPTYRPPWPTAGDSPLPF